MSEETSESFPPICFAFETKVSSPRSRASPFKEGSLWRSVPIPTKARNDESMSKLSKVSEAACKRYDVSRVPSITTLVSSFASTAQFNRKVAHANLTPLVLDLQLSAIRFAISIHRGPGLAAPIAFVTMRSTVNSIPFALGSSDESEVTNPSRASCASSKRTPESSASMTILRMSKMGKTWSFSHEKANPSASVSVETSSPPLTRDWCCRPRSTALSKHWKCFSLNWLAGVAAELNSLILPSMASFLHCSNRRQVLRGT
mmetsp:Transcript_9371/g.26659  ORF Transcript_9371/g.26659 Transcript_9371/m.26659 type:complete len:259 (-) Transcript_9371:1605-2381(-)